MGGHPGPSPPPLTLLALASAPAPPCPLPTLVPACLCTSVHTAPPACLGRVTGHLLPPRKALPSLPYPAAAEHSLTEMKTGLGCPPVSNPSMLPTALKDKTPTSSASPPPSQLPRWTFSHPPWGLAPLVPAARTSPPHPSAHLTCSLLGPS